jgi:hypothetical protein
MIPDSTGNPYSPSTYSIAPEQTGVIPLQGFAKVACIFFIILGALGVLGGLGAFAQLAIAAIAKGNNPNQIDPLANIPGGLVLTVLMNVVGILVAVGLIVAGALGLQKKKLGGNLMRQMAAFMVFYKIVETALTVYLTFGMIQPMKEQILKDAAAQPNQPEVDIGMFIEIGMYVGLGFSVLVGLAMLLFYLFTYLHFSKPRTQSMFS